MTVRSSITMSERQSEHLDSLQSALGLRSRSETVRQAVVFAYVFTRAKYSPTDKRQFDSMLRSIKGANA